MEGFFDCGTEHIVILLIEKELKIRVTEFLLENRCVLIT